MHIAVDMSAVRLAGPRVYCQGFLPALAGLIDASDELTIFGPDTIEGLIAPIIRANVHFVCDPILTRVPARIWWQQTGLPRALKAMSADVLFEPFDMGPWRGACPMVLGIRNPNPVILEGGVFPLSWRGKASARLHKALVSNACRRARLLIFPSRYAAAEVGGRLPGGTDCRRVVHHGLDSEFWTEDAGVDRTRRGKYILFASKFYAQKRAPLLLEAFAEWRRRYGREDYKLIYCGEELRSPLVKQVQRRAEELGLTKAVELRGVVSRVELRALCLGAAELVLPTVMETFGFPYIEAMASETPLVCADIEVARELCGEVPWYFVPDDVSSLSEALEQALRDGPERAAKLALGASRAKSFSWRKEAEETLACLREAAAMK